MKKCQISKLLYKSIANYLNACVPPLRTPSSIHFTNSEASTFISMIFMDASL